MRQEGEVAAAMYGNKQVRLPPGFRIALWDENRAQDINLGSVRNFVRWTRGAHPEANVSLVRCDRDCVPLLAGAHAIGLVGSIADRDRKELGAWRMTYLRREPRLKDAVHFLSMTGDEYCQLKTHQNVDLVFRNYWDAPYMKEFGAHLPEGHAAWMPMGPGHAMPLVQPSELRPGTPRKYLFNLVVSLNTHRDRKRLKDIVTSNLTAVAAHGAQWFVHYTKHWSPKYDASHNYLMPPAWKEVLLDSLYTLVPSGKNQECFRLWEALEAGSIPVVVNGRQPQCGDSWVPFREEGNPMVFLDSWEELPVYLEEVAATEASRRLAESRQSRLVKWYASFKNRHYTKLLNLLVRAAERKRSFVTSGQT
eukprot:NODE_811_length_1436_cov_103.269647_g671_i0.p1 GENE.NODE_811_length_1436_cov_103.269647_g671_i0~~NODE_811_length_1436_cov_103.269647_g671_i0.p1  ORF type:complete len:364 (+),score=87.98 NODE_811_length_1436_cov_103.269647_g671_i0:247-1338(+)